MPKKRATMADVLPRIEDDPEVGRCQAALAELQRAEHADAARALSAPSELTATRQRRHDPEEWVPLRRELAEIEQRREARRPTLRDAERAAARARAEATARIVAEYVVPAVVDLVARVTPATA